MIEVRAVKDADIRELARTMRQEDRREAASCGYGAEEAVRGSVNVSEVSYCGVRNGKVVFIGGVQEISKALGSVWLLSSEEVENCKVEYLETCQALMREVLRRWPVLQAQIDARYTRACKWFEALGAAAVAFGKAKDGTDFKIYEVRR